MASVLSSIMNVYHQHRAASFGFIKQQKHKKFNSNKLEWMAEILIVFDFTHHKRRDRIRNVCSQAIAGPNWIRSCLTRFETIQTMSVVLSSLSSSFLFLPYIFVRKWDVVGYSATFNGISHPKAINYFRWNGKINFAFLFFRSNHVLWPSETKHYTRNGAYHKLDIFRLFFAWLLCLRRFGRKTFIN